MEAPSSATIIEEEDEGEIDETGVEPKVGRCRLTLSNLH